MAAAVAVTTGRPTTDTRCVGGGGGESSPQVVQLPSATTPAMRSSGGRRHGSGGKGLKASRSPTGSCFSSTPSSSSDENEDDGDSGGVAEFGGRGVVAVKSSTVAVKRLKDLQQHLVDLDDLELLDRHLDDGDDSSPTTDAENAADIAAELRQKNKDLVLAARLGKALLAKNDELSLMNERLAEEYGDKLEVRVLIQ